MKTKKCFIFTLLIIIQVGILCSCTKEGEIINQTNNDTEIQMEVSKYTDILERDITIKNTQSGSFSIQYSPSAGKININITDGDGKNLLSIDEQATIQDYQPMVTHIKEGNGTYHLKVDMKEYTGSFSITWDTVYAEVRAKEVVLSDVIKA